jgi:hypothetical protein
MASNYTINWTDGSLKTPFTLNGGTIDSTTTSLSLTGKSSNNWGERIQENFLHLLENFASSGAAPNNPTIGQTWYNHVDRSFQVNIGGDNWDGLAKHRTGYTSVIPIGGSAKDPHSPIDSVTNVAPVRSYQVGDLWFDTSTHQLKYASHASITPTDLTSNLSWIPIASDRIDFPNISTAFIPTPETGVPDFSGYDGPIIQTYRKGHLWYDTTYDILKVYDGLVFVPLALKIDYTPTVSLSYGVTPAASVPLPRFGTHIPVGSDVFLYIYGAEPNTNCSVVTQIFNTSTLRYEIKDMKSIDIGIDGTNGLQLFFNTYGVSGTTAQYFVSLSNNKIYSFVVTFT